MIPLGPLSCHTLESFEKALQEEILMCKLNHYKKGEVIIRENTYVRAFPLPLRGNLRVYRKADDRELLLYYTGPGEICTMSIGACYSQKPFHAEVASVNNCEVVMIPVSKLHEWQRKYVSWNTYIFKAFSVTSDLLFRSIDSIVFDTIDRRIKDYLYQLYDVSRDPVIRITHQELANELGTTRVVISRILKCLELEGVVDLLRGGIKVKTLN